MTSVQISRTAFSKILIWPPSQPFFFNSIPNQVMKLGSYNSNSTVNYNKIHCKLF